MQSGISKTYGNEKWLGGFLDGDGQHNRKGG
jgi:hypothetical protein